MDCWVIFVYDPSISIQRANAFFLWSGAEQPRAKPRGSLFWPANGEKSFWNAPSVVDPSRKGGLSVVFSRSFSSYSKTEECLWWNHFLVDVTSWRSCFFSLRDRSTSGQGAWEYLACKRFSEFLRSFVTHCVTWQCLENMVFLSFSYFPLYWGKPWLVHSDKLVPMQCRSIPGYQLQVVIPLITIKVKALAISQQINHPEGRGRCLW